MTAFVLSKTVYEMLHQDNNQQQSEGLLMFKQFDDGSDFSAKWFLKDRDFSNLQFWLEKKLETVQN